MTRAEILYFGVMCLFIGSNLTILSHGGNIFAVLGLSFCSFSLGINPVTHFLIKGTND